jgi:hypothetical protein
MLEFYFEHMLGCAEEGVDELLSHMSIHSLEHV